MKNRQYKHLFFDLDHTLWDFEANSKAVIFILHQHHQLQDRGVEQAEQFFQVFSEENERLWIRYRKGLMKQDELRVKRFRNTLLHFKIADEQLAQSMAYEYIELLPQQVNLLPYAKDVLQHCQDAGYRMHIITNGFEEVQYRKMKSSGIDGYFEEVFTSERCMCLKPMKEIFDFALQACGAQAAESVMIGDNWEVDIAGAINAGWDQVFYNPSKIKVSGEPTYQINCLSEMKEIF